MKRVLLLFLILASSIFAQQKSENAFGIKLKGYVKTDVMYDSRQTVAVREGHLLLYPAGENPDQDGKDINDVATFNMLAVQTRLTGVITAPDVFGAKTTGIIEAAFFGHSDADVNGFRLRHAFLKLAWENASLLIGQYWHPMFITEVFPGTISFNTGMPFQPFSRNPQIKYTYGIKNFSVSVTALTQRDFSNTGPAGGSSSYLRNSGMPIMDITVKYKTKNLVAGVGVNYKTLLPRQYDTLVDTLYNENKFITDAKISSISAMGFAKVVINDLAIKAEGVYGENLTDLVMLGGYAVSKVDNNGFVTEYTNIKTMSAWMDLTYGKSLQVGLFAGYTKNLGADDNIIAKDKIQDEKSYYSRGNDIASVMRISPRVQYSAGKTRYAAEVEYTAADYGIPDLKGVVKNTATVANLRLLFGVYLFF